MNNDINQLKVVFVEKKRPNKWLAGQRRKAPGTISNWCMNSMQSNLDTF